MLKRCHKCQKIYDTEEYFCNNCGSILYDEKAEEKAEPAQVSCKTKPEIKPETVKRAENEHISKESNLLIKQIALLCKYVTGGTFRICTIFVIAAVAFGSVFEAFMQYATVAMGGEKLNLYAASHIAFSLAISAFYALLPAISMYKISMDAESYVAGSEGAFIWRANKSLTYILSYFIIQTVIMGGTIGFILNASVISVLSDEITTGFILSLLIVVVALATMPYFISGLVTFSSAKGCLKKAVPITARGAKVFAVFFMIISILSTLLWMVSAIILAVLYLTDIKLPGTAPIINMFSKMSGTYLIYVLIMFIRSVADIVISAGFLRFINKLKRIKE